MKILQITTAENHDEYCTTKTVRIASLKWQLNLKRLFKFTNAADMGTKYCLKQPSI